MLRSPLTIALTVLLAVLLFSSCQPRELDPEQVMERSRKAAEDIRSYREVIHYRESSIALDFTSVKIKTCDGFDISERTFVRDMQTTGSYVPCSESITCDGYLYTRDLSADSAWRTESRRYVLSSERLTMILDTYLMGSEIDGMTVERLDGNEVYHLHLVYPESDFFVTNNKHESGDLWIARDTFYPVRFDELWTDSSGPQGSNTMYMRTIKKISMINEGFEIVPPI